MDAAYSTNSIVLYCLNISLVPAAFHLKPEEAGMLYFVTIVPAVERSYAVDNGHETKALVLDPR